MPEPPKKKSKRMGMESKGPGFAGGGGGAVEGDVEEGYGTNIVPIEVNIKHKSLLKGTSTPSTNILI